MELLDINKFIEDNKLKQVTSPEIFQSNSESFHPDGVYSEEIFGRVGSTKRNEIFAYIDLKNKYIHPIIYPKLKKIIPDFNKVVNGKLYIELNAKNRIVSTEKQTEYTGINGIIKFIFDNKDKIDWDYYRNSNEKIINFLLENLDKIFIDKWLVLPAGIRDMQEINGQYQEQQLSKLYRRLIHLIKNRAGDDSDLGTVLFGGDNTQINQTILVDDLKIQNTIISIDDEIFELMKSKYGLIRGTRLSKRVDYNARLVLSHNSNLKPDEIGIPWLILLKLYEPFVIHHISNNDKYSLIASEIEEEYDSVSVETIRKYISYLIKYPNLIKSNIKQLFIEMLNEIIEGKYDNVQKYVIVIRHPVESRSSVLGLKPKIIDKEIYSAELPQVVFSAIGGDVDGDIVNIYSLHTKSSIEEAKKISPVNGIGKYEISHFNSLRVDPSMDMALGVWMLTK